MRIILKNSWRNQYKRKVLQRKKPKVDLEDTYFVDKLVEAGGKEVKGANETREGTNGR